MTRLEMSYLILWILLLQQFASSTKPNIVILMVDDLGVADLACFGNDSLKTPNIDKLASEGARLTHSLSSESICTPSRAAFLTGRYAVRSGMSGSEHSPTVRVLTWSALPGGLPRNETTFAKALKDVGYSTGLIGKWHLGLNKERADDFYYHPINHGFQHFYGVPLTNLRDCDGKNRVIDHAIHIDHWREKTVGTILVTALIAIFAVLLGKLRKLYFILFMLVVITLPGFILFLDHNKQLFDCFLMRNYSIVEQPLILENLTVRFTNDAISFIHANQEKPFLLFMSYLKVHTALFTTKSFRGHSHHSKYGDNVEEMDWSVGKIVGALDTLGIRNNTFVYFTSDNGPHVEEVINGEYHGGWKGRFKGGKGQSWEGGIRVPSIASWPSQIPAGIEVTEPTMDLNVFPTVLNIAGASIPDDHIIDGKDMLPLLKQQAEYTPNEFLFHYCAKSVHAIRYRPQYGTTVWKAHFMTPKWDPGTQECRHLALCGCYGDDVNTHEPPLLYDITKNPEEEEALDPSGVQYQSVMKQIFNALENHQQTVESVPLQLDSLYWHPWLQSCCKFPYCKCSENITHLEHFP